jgi:hypothetical protein
MKGNVDEEVKRKVVPDVRRCLMWGRGGKRVSPARPSHFNSTKFVKLERGEQAASNNGCLILFLW